MADVFVLSPQARDLTGQTFGRLTALRPVGKKQRNVVWEFSCTCGNTYTAEGCWVTAQHRKATNPEAPSCGCLNRETTHKLRFSHGFSKHPLFWVWVAMVERCHNPANPSYCKYGAKGVYVCDAWRNSAEVFISWALANGWEKGLHLDKDVRSRKLGVPKHYSPETCQFLPPSENCRYTDRWFSARNQ